MFFKQLNSEFSLEDDFQHIPIWYVYKNGIKIDLNNPSLIVEDYNGKFYMYRQLGLAQIFAWQKSRKILPFGKRIPKPHIIFYELNSPW